ncbi:MAG: leucine-rich repeat protein SHOC2 [Arenicella sp.]|jgi:leucine-rich repeat protein SHOC2
MRLIASIFLLSLLCVYNVGYSQRNKMYNGLDEALTAHPDSVYRLDLSKQRLEKVPTEIYAFKNLQELNLSKNKLDSIPKEMNFDDLRILDLTKNKFKIFPACIYEMTSIRNLFLGKNNIEIIPDEIGRMHDLIVLDMWYNPIDDLPETLTNLRNLRSLDLSGLNFSQTFKKKWN